MVLAQKRRFLKPIAITAAVILVAGALVGLRLQGKKEEPKTPQDPFADGEKKDDEKKLVDKEGREYRVCPQCAYNMYKQGRMWVCENCGYSYVE